jgi:sugar lactone lactonase YvrE
MHSINFNDIPRARSLGKGYWFPECPRYFNGEVYLVDGPAVRAVDWSGTQRTVADIPATMLCLGLQVETNGDVYVGAPMDRKVFRVREGKVDLVADISGAVAAPNNELIRLPGGQFLLGNMGFNPMTEPEPKPGGLYLVSNDGSVRKTGPDIVFANGMLLTEDAASLYVVGDRGQSIYEVTLNKEGEAVDWTLHPLKCEPRASADGLGRARDGSFWYGDMLCGAAVSPGEDGSPRIMMHTGQAHATACTVFTHEGEEWLATTAVQYPALPEHAHERTGRLIVAPLKEIEAACAG